MFGADVEIGTRRNGLRDFSPIYTVSGPNFDLDLLVLISTSASDLATGIVFSTL
jgi:hypothetical protein